MGSRRLHAINRLGRIANPASSPTLIMAMESVGLDIRAEWSRLREMHTTPVNLGTIGPAAIQVPIQTPEIDFISVQTSTRISVPRSLRVATGAAAQMALTNIAGADMGEGVAAWKSWWDENKDELLPESKK